MSSVRHWRPVRAVVRAARRLARTVKHGVRGAQSKRARARTEYNAGAARASSELEQLLYLPRVSEQVKAALGDDSDSGDDSDDSGSSSSGSEAGERRAALRYMLQPIQQQRA